MRIELDNLSSRLVENVYKNLEDHMYESQISNFGVYDVAEEVVNEYVKGILSDEKVIAKLTKSIGKIILDKHKIKEKARKIDRARNLKLWNATKGKIPCLRECGYHQEKTKDQVIYEGNNFVCSSCSNELEGNNSEIFKIFDNRNVFDIYNIK